MIFSRGFVKNILAVMVNACIAFPPSAHAEDIKRPEWVSSSAGINYWFSKNLIIDTDETLKEYGIEASTCIYRSRVTGKDSAYKGLGPCLYLNFQESMKTDELSGVTYFWVKGASRDSAPVEIHWRPTHGGMKALLSQVLEMKFEKQLYWLRKYMGKKESAEQIHYKEYIGGSWNLILPDNKEVIGLLTEAGNPWIAKYLARVKEIEFQLEPTDRQNGLVIHTGQLKAELRSQEGATSEDLVFSIFTNMNVLVRDRKFTYKVHFESNSTAGNGLLGGDHAP